MGSLYAGAMTCPSVHSLTARLLAALLLLALVAVPPVALALPAMPAAAAASAVAAPAPAALPGQAAVAEAAMTMADCPQHHRQDAAAVPAPARAPVQAPAEHPCKAGCAACGGCIFAQAALLPAAALPLLAVASVPAAVDTPPLRLTRRSHPPLRPPSL